jgi:hypothetical protein
VDPQFEEIIARAAAKHGVDPELLRKIIMAESAGDPRATSPRGAQGLMQLMPDTASGLGVKDPFDPEQNIMGGANYLSQMTQRAGGDKRKALAAYNYGPKNVFAGKAWPAETMSYVNKILGPEATPAPSPMQVADVQPTAQPVVQPKRPYPQPAPPPPDQPQDPTLAYNWKNALGGIGDKVRGAWDNLTGPADAQADSVNKLAVPPPVNPTSVPPAVVDPTMSNNWRRSLGSPPPRESTDTVGDTSNRGPLGMSRFRPDVRGVGDTYVSSPPDAPVKPTVPDRVLRQPSAADRYSQYMKEAPNPKDYKLPFWKKALTGLTAGLVSANDPEAGIALAKEANTGAYNRATQTYHTKGENLDRIMRAEELASRGETETKKLNLEEREQSARERYWGALGGAATEKADKYGTAGVRRTGAMKPIPMGQQNAAWQSAAERLYVTNPKVRKYLQKIPGKNGPSFIPADQNQDSWIGRSFDENELNELQNVIAMIDKEAQKFTGRMVDPYDRIGFGQQE